MTSAVTVYQEVQSDLWRTMAYSFVTNTTSSTAVEITQPSHTLDFGSEWRALPVMMQETSFKFLDDEPEIYTEDDGEPA